MNPGTQIAIMGAFTGFLLKTSLGFCICWAISKVVVSPRGRFLVWFGFLAGSGCYWLWLASSLAFHGSRVLPAQMMQAGAVATALAGRWQIQDSWAHPVSILLWGVGAVYLAVLGSFLFVRIKKHAQLRWILRFSYKAPDAIEGVFRSIAENLGTANVRLLVLSGIHSPATFGWIEPTVLLPPLCLDQDEGELGDIFRHELQHVRRRDFVFNSIASFCRALLFFHPAVWYAMGRLQLESELACDLAVVSDSPERRAIYAECLVRFARLNVAREPTPWNLDFAGSSVQLKVRVRSMLAGTRKIPGWLLGLRVSLGLVLFAGFLGIAPSLFVALSYEQEAVVRPAVAALPDSHPQIRLHRGGFVNAMAHGQASPARPSANLFSSAPAAVPEMAAMEAAPDAPSDPGRILSSQHDPTLKKRGDGGGTAGQKGTPTRTILLSNEPTSSSADVVTKSAGVVSDITAGASDALNIASHGRDRATTH